MEYENSVPVNENGKSSIIVDIRVTLDYLAEKKNNNVKLRKKLYGKITKKFDLKSWLVSCHLFFFFKKKNPPFFVVFFSSISKRIA